MFQHKDKQTQTQNTVGDPPNGSPWQLGGDTFQGTVWKSTWKSSNQQPPEHHFKTFWQDFCLYDSVKFHWWILDACHLITLNLTYPLLCKCSTTSWFAKFRFKSAPCSRQHLLNLAWEGIEFWPEVDSQVSTLVAIKGISAAQISQPLNVNCCTWSTNHQLVLKRLSWSQNEGDF